MATIIGTWVVVATFATPAAASWFGTPTATKLGATVKGLAAGPINTESSDHREFVVAATGTTGVDVMIAEPSGRLGAPQQVTIAGEAVSVAIGDVNGDGHDDIVVGSIDEPAISVLLGHGDGTFAGEPGSGGSAVTSPGPYTHNPAFLALGKLDGNGTLDLVTANGGAPGADPATMSTFTGSGSGTFTLMQTYGVGNTYQSANHLNVADLDGNGTADIVSGDEGCGGVGEGHQLGVFLGDGAGSFAAEGERFGACIAGLDLGDVNGDGIPDIIISHHAGVFDNTSTAEVALGNGDGTFQPFTASEVPREANQIAAADFNGDGRADVAVSSSTGDVASGSSGHEPELTVMQGNGDGTLSEVETVLLANNPGPVTSADLNGSSNPPDIILGDGTEVAVFPNEITGPVPPGRLPSSPSEDQPLAAGPKREWVGIVGEPISPAWGFTDADSAARASDFSASVDWGDNGGTRTVGQVSGISLGATPINGTFVITGPTYAYYQAGRYTATANVVDNVGRNDRGGSTVDVPATVVVLPAAFAKKSKNWFGIVVKGVFDVGAGVGCVAGIATSETGVGVAVAAAGCPSFLLDGGSLLADVADPPDATFRPIYRPQGLPVARVPTRCRVLKGAKCDQLLRATRRYVRNYARFSSACEATGITANRFGGAVEAGDAQAAELQREAAHAYLVRLRMTYKHLRETGSDLARILVHDHLNGKVSRKAILRGRHRLLRLKGVPNWVIHRLISDHLVESKAALRTLVRRGIDSASPARSSSFVQGLIR